MKRMISGIKPSGKSLTLGNYIGAIKEFIKYQNYYDLYVFIADLHALTIYQKSEDLQDNIETLAATYLAVGLDPTKCVLFRQSDVPAHSQLEWVLTCNTDLPDLTKMPQYKNYCEQHKNKAVPTGMLLYPSLMNADILLYDADYVPVGQDQKPHVDLTTVVAERFNKKYTNSFKIPTALLAESGAKIMSLSNPLKKMSKSESDTGTIYLLDDEATIRKKIRKAVTDSEFKIYYNLEHKPGISNLLVILSCLSGKSIPELETYYKSENNYGKFKDDVADVVWAELSKLQKQIATVKNSGLITTILLDGSKKANDIANEKINFIYKQIGLR